MTQYTDDFSSCNVIGDGDVYGIGVRLGYYFSWISGLIAVAFDNPKAVRDTRRGVILISLAVFIIIIRNTTNGNFALLEWSIVFPMAIWAPLLDNAPGSIGCVMTVLAIINTWLYISQGRNNNDGHETPAAGDSQMDRFQMQMQHIQSSQDVDTMSTVETIMKGRPFWSTIYHCFAEKILAGNNIDLSDAPLLSSGQLIPFIVGLAGLVSTVWSVTVGERLAFAHNKRRERALPQNENIT
ncbi:hypothetical protein BDW67DRAFT_172606 [Aspergillus spinulosporus]